MASTSDEVTTLLVAPVPPRPTGPMQSPDADPQATPLAVTAGTHAGTSDATVDARREHVEAVRASLRQAGDGTFLLGTPSTPTVLSYLGRWHRRHPHLGLLDTSLVAPAGTRIEPDASGATRWLTPAHLRWTPLPDLELLLSALSGPRDVLLAGMDEVLALPESELARFGAYALLAGLSRAGGVVLTRYTPEAPSPDTSTSVPDDRTDPAERLAAYRPAGWPRQQREPGYTVVLEADGASTAELVATIDSVLASSRGDLEIAVRTADGHQPSLAGRFAEEPRFRTLETLRIAPRVLLVAAGSLLDHEALLELARLHEQQQAGLLLITHAGDDRRRCAASFETGAWRRAAALTGHGAIDAVPSFDGLAPVLEPHYQTWWCNADDVGLRRPGVIARASDLLDGTSAPSRRVLAELERQQQLLASTRAQLRRAERDLERLRGHPLVRIGLAVRRRLP